MLVYLRVNPIIYHYITNYIPIYSHDIPLIYYIRYWLFMWNSVRCSIRGSPFHKEKKRTPIPRNRPSSPHILWKRPCFFESFNTQKRCENGNDPYLEILWNTSPYSTHTSITVLLDGLKPQKLLIGDDDIPGRKYLRPPAMLLWGGTVVPFFHGWLRVDLGTFRRGPAWCRKFMSLGLQTPPHRVLFTPLSLGLHLPGSNGLRSPCWTGLRSGVRQKIGETLSVSCPSANLAMGHPLFIDDFPLETSI